MPGIYDLSPDPGMMLKYFETMAKPGPQFNWGKAITGGLNSYMATDLLQERTAQEELQNQIYQQKLEQVEAAENMKSEIADILEKYGGSGGVAAALPEIQQAFLQAGNLDEALKIARTQQQLAIGNARLARYGQMGQGKTAKKSATDQFMEGLGEEEEVPQGPGLWDRFKGLFSGGGGGEAQAETPPAAPAVSGAAPANFNLLSWLRNNATPVAEAAIGKGVSGWADTAANFGDYATDLAESLPEAAGGVPFIGPLIRDLQLNAPSTKAGADVMRGYADQIRGQMPQFDRLSPQDILSSAGALTMDIAGLKKLLLPYFAAKGFSGMGEELTSQGMSPLEALPPSVMSALLNYYGMKGPVGQFTKPAGGILKNAVAGAGKMGVLSPAITQSEEALRSAATGEAPNWSLPEILTQMAESAGVGGLVGGLTGVGSRERQPSFEELQARMRQMIPPQGPAELGPMQAAADRYMGQPMDATPLGVDPMVAAAARYEGQPMDATPLAVDPMVAAAMRYEGQPMEATPREMTPPEVSPQTKMLNRYEEQDRLEVKPPEPFLSPEPIDWNRPIELSPDALKALDELDPVAGLIEKAADAKGNLDQRLSEQEMPAPSKKKEPGIVPTQAPQKAPEEVKLANEKEMPTPIKEIEAAAAPKPAQVPELTADEIRAKVQSRRPESLPALNSATSSSDISLPSMKTSPEGISRPSDSLARQIPSESTERKQSSLSYKYANTSDFSEVLSNEGFISKYNSTISELPYLDNVLKTISQGRFYVAVPKTIEKSAEKIFRKVHDPQTPKPEYDENSIGDMIRGTVWAKDEVDVKALYNRINSEYPTSAVEDFFTEPSRFGYRGMQGNIETPSGNRGEWQLHTPASFYLKEKIHPDYEVWRGKAIPEVEQIKLRKKADKLYAQGLKLQKQGKLTADGQLRQSGPQKQAISPELKPAQAEVAITAQAVTGPAPDRPTIPWSKVAEEPTDAKTGENPWAKPKEGTWSPSVRKFGKSFYLMRERTDIPMEQRELQIHEGPFDTYYDAIKARNVSTMLDEFKKGVRIEDYRPAEPWKASDYDVAVVNDTGNLVSDRSSIFRLEDIPRLKTGGAEKFAEIDNYWRAASEAGISEITPIGAAAVSHKEKYGRKNLKEREVFLDNVFFDNGMAINGYHYATALKAAGGEPIFSTLKIGDIKDANVIAVYNADKQPVAIIMPRKTPVPHLLVGRVGSDAKNQIPPRHRWLSERGATTLLPATELAEGLRGIADSVLREGLPTQTQLDAIAGPGKAFVEQVPESSRDFAGALKLNPFSQSGYKYGVLPGPLGKAVGSYRRFFRLQETLAKKYPQFRPAKEGAESVFIQEHRNLYDAAADLMPYITLKDKSRVNEVFLAERELQKTGQQFPSTIEAYKRLGLDSHEAEALLGWNKFSKNAVNLIEEGLLADPPRWAKMSPNHWETYVGYVKDFTGRMREVGYFPYSRWGDYYVWSKDANEGEGHYSLHESAKEAKREQLRLIKAGATVQIGKVKKPEGALFEHMSPDLHMIINDLTAEGGPTFSKYPRSGFSGHLLSRKFTPGASTDVERTIKSYMTSVSRWHATKLGNARMDSAIEALSGEPALQAQAVRLKERLTKGGGDLARTRRFLSLWYLTRPVSAMLNATQGITSTFPELVTYEGVMKGGYRFLRASALKAQKYFSSEKAFAKAHPELYSALKTAERDGVFDSKNTEELGGRYAEHFRKSWGDKALGLFKAAEYNNRLHAFIAGYDMAKSKGLSQGEAVQFGRRVSQDTQYDYTLADRPEIATGWRAMPTTFMLYSGNYIRSLRNKVGGSVKTPWGTNTKPLRGLATQLGVMGALGGATAIAGLSQLIKALEAAGYDPKGEARKFLQRFMSDDEISTLFYGLPRLLGVSATANIALSELAPGIEQGVIPAVGRMALGVAADIPQRIGRAKMLYERGRTLEAMKQLMPPLARNITDAIQWSVPDAQGKRWMRAPSTGEPLVKNPTVGERVGRALGLTPQRLNLKYEERQSADVLKEEAMDNHKINEKMAWAKYNGDKAEIRRLFKWVHEHNKTAKPSAKIEINWPAVQTKLDSLKTPGYGTWRYMPKKARPELESMQKRFRSMTE